MRANQNVIYSFYDIKNNYKKTVTPLNEMIFAISKLRRVCMTSGHLRPPATAPWKA